MALTKEVKIDQIEIVGEFKAVQIRELITIMEDGKEISRTFHRRVIEADSDIATETDEIKNICGVVHTKAVKDAWQVKKALDNINK